MRILFIATSRIGVAVISTGILDHLRLTYPQARFTVATGTVSEGIFLRMPGLENLILFDKQKYDAHWLELWKQLAGKFWHRIIDVRGSALAWLLLARHRQSIRGGRRPGRRYMQLGAALGLNPAPLPVAWTNAADDSRAAALLPAKRLIALGPTANWSGKIWPPERFAATYTALATADSIPVIFGGPGATEAALAAPLAAALPNGLNLTGQLSLPEVAACMRRVALFIGNDSGLMHLAAAAGAPTLGLFGPSQVTQYAPAGRLTATAVAPGPAGQGAMADLTVETVLAAARELL